MAEKHWEVIKEIQCRRAGCKAALEVEVVYPAEFMPDQAARITAQRCSLGQNCSMLGQVACMWAGSNPDYDPFLEKPEI
jgi:hypothetical protein